MPHRERSKLISKLWIGIVVDHRDQFLLVDGFAKVVVAAALETAIHIPLHGIGREGDNRRGVALLAEL